jgi:Zn-dependent protease
MLAALDPVILTEGLIRFLILLVCLSVHEWAHAWTASKLGDPTARMAGRVTFNPLSHIDPIGTLAIPLFMVFMSASGGGGFGIIGWAKPVPVDSRYFKKPVRDDILVTMAGPFSNLVLCLLAAVIGGFALRMVPEAQVASAFDLVLEFIRINALLAVFNMIPVPPLDGSAPLAARRPDVGADLLQLRPLRLLHPHRADQHPGFPTGAHGRDRDGRHAVRSPRRGALRARMTPLARKHAQAHPAARRGKSSPCPP